MSAKTTVVLGASPKPDRFSNKALRMLREHGYHVVPVHPVHTEIEGLPAAKSLAAITDPVDTLTMYVNAAQSASLAEAILRLAPRRIIFNPGAENAELERKLSEAGIECRNACTLVMLRSKTY